MNMNISTRYRAAALVLFLGIWAGTAGAQEPEKEQPENAVIHAQDVEAKAPDQGAVTESLGQNWEEVGLASWYGPRLQGRKTASGERFDKNALTAAHRTLPLGAWVEVLNLANGRRVQVKINDRGPHTRGVVIDLSQAAAQALGLIRQGRAKVKLSFRQNTAD